MAPIKWQFKAGSNTLNLTALLPFESAAPAKVKITVTVQSQHFTGSGSGSVDRDQWEALSTKVQHVISGSTSSTTSGAKIQAELFADNPNDFRLMIENSHEAGRIIVRGHVGRVVVDAQKPYTHQLQFGFTCLAEQT